MGEMHPGLFVLTDMSSMGAVLKRIFTEVKIKLQNFDIKNKGNKSSKRGD